LVVLGFALIGFVSVPLGDRTGLEHLRAVLATDAAARLGSGLWDAFTGARAKLFESGSAEPREPSGPRPEPPDLERSTGATGSDAGAPDASLSYHHCPRLQETRPQSLVAGEVFGEHRSGAYSSYESTGAQPKRSPRPGSAGVGSRCEVGQ
jgi:hypothetical protein